jgi:predicted ATPase/class 3 adenylate cyclase
MADLPTGTVTLLFSDIEGSTRLLSRLGAAYADALDGQRQVLREAWTEYGGTEMGTEGDSFFVVFATASEAVAAAVQAQRQLDGFEWPAGEQVRVRMGIHTGTPVVHDGGYVGMDVHRAARISSAAHGGQVVLSEATAALVSGGLPGSAGLRDLGRHQLKDITQPEHLFQLTIEGLPTEFAPLKTLGAASSLPRPDTALVGRVGELAELTALLSSPEVRLATLTGPGGTGKTRLAVALAHQLVRRFPDGVYFVPLATATTSEVVWTSIAEVLDVPPEGRIPPAFFDHVAHRSALLVLDNLEQVDDADTVVGELLREAPQVVVIATSRRPLHLPAEHVHPVPPLELPQDITLADAEHSGAVQLFVQHARKVRPSFALTAANAGDVAEVCRRLDGLPLAIELAAARSRLLSPAALLSRLDTALDIAAASRQGPSRQKTLRDTIAWSYQLLNPTQQAFFRRLGVFAGGADLDALAAVTADIVHDTDPLDLIIDLVDASLITIADDHAGEPRISMLETIRSFAIDELTVADEAVRVRYDHLAHYHALAGQLERMTLSSSEYAEGRARTDIELDNVREALGWAFQQPPGDAIPSDALLLGLQLCTSMKWFWMSGYLNEGRRWYSLAIERAGGESSPEVADCLAGLAHMLVWQGEPQRAFELASTSETMARKLGDEERRARALGVLGTAQHELGDTEAAVQSLQEAMGLYERSGNKLSKAARQADLALIERSRQRYDRAEALFRDSVQVMKELDALDRVAEITTALAELLAVTGRAEEAETHLRGLVDDVLKLRIPSLVIELALAYVPVVLRLGDARRAARLSGAEAAMRERNGIARLAVEADAQELLAPYGGVISAEEWDHYYRLGRGESLEEMLQELSRGGGQPAQTASPR